MSTIRDERHRHLDALSVRASRAFVDSGLHGLSAEVAVALDASPRMAPLYESGHIQELTTALLALAMKFDDDGQVPLWTFSDEARHVGEIRRADHHDWVRRHVGVPSSVAAGEARTRLSPLIDAIGRRYFPREWELPPTPRQVGDKLKRTVLEHSSVLERRACAVFVIVVTSGDCDDVLEATRHLRKASRLPIFWQFAGLDPSGESRFRFLRGLDKLTDMHVDACGFFEPPVRDFAARAGGFDEEALFAGLLNELPRYLADPKVAAMLLPPVRDDDAQSSADPLEALVLGLPEREQARRERERLERERRRELRAQEAQDELARAARWPTIRADAQSAQADDGDDVAPPAEPRRPSPPTRPYQAVVPASPPRRATVSFAPVEPAPEADEPTVETAIERLARIRARRQARNTNPGG